MDWVQRLEELIRTPGVVGYEEEVRRKIQEWAQAWAKEIRIDPLGNLLLGRKGEREGHLAFAIDTISAPDFPQAPQPFKDQIALGKGPVLRLVDNQMVAHQPTRRWVEAVAREMGIGYQVGVAGGSTDAAALQLAQQGLSVLPLCIPCRYTHSTVEVVSLKDIEDSIRLLLQVIRAFGSVRPKGLNDA